MEFAEHSSVVLRFAQFLPGLDQENLKLSSIQEGAALLGPIDVSGVELGILDLSTYNHTGTFKDWVACVAVAYCLQTGTGELVTQTSGNTGNSIAAYASRHGIRATILYPERSRYKIQPALAGAEGIRFIEIAGSERVLKRWTRRLAAELRVPWLPNWELQIAGNKLRAYLLREYELSGGTPYNWHVQALSSGYGVFGLYRGLRELLETSTPPPFVPRLLGVQQEAVAPYYELIEGGESQASATLLEPTLFRSRPSRELVRQMKEIVLTGPGRIMMVQNTEYVELENDAARILNDLGMDVARVRVEPGWVPAERSGLIALAGTLKAIREGLLTRGDRALVCITGGIGENRAELFEPAWSISVGEGYEALMKIL